MAAGALGKDYCRPLLLSKAGGYLGKMREHGSVENIRRKQKTHKLLEEKTNEERD